MTEIVAVKNGIPVAWRERPFTGRVRQEIMPQGLLIEEIVASIFPDPTNFFWRVGIVKIDDQVVPREMWRFVRPKNASRPIAVTLHIPLSGGGGGGGQGGGKNPIAIVAAIALIVIATAISGGALASIGLTTDAFIGTVSLAQIAGAVVTVGGALAIAALTAPPGQSAGKGFDDKNPSPSSLSGNTLQAGASIPRVVGMFRLFPPLISEPLVEQVGDDQYVEAIYGLAGPHNITDLKIDGTSIADLTEITSEILPGFENDPDSSIVTRQARTVNSQTILAQHEMSQTNQQNLLDQNAPANSVPDWTSFYTMDSPDEAWIGFAFANGLIDNQNAGTSVAVPIRTRMRLVGSDTWLNLPEVEYFSNKSGPRQGMIKFMFKAQDFTAPVPPGNNGFIYAMKFFSGQVAGFATSPGWTADASFSNGAGSDFMGPTNFNQDDGNSALSTNIKNVALYHDRAEFYLDPATFPKGRYEIQILRGYFLRNTDFTPSSTYVTSSVGTVDPFLYFKTGANNAWRTVRTYQNVSDQLTILRVSNIWNEPVLAKKGIATIAIRAKNRRVGALSVLASGLTYDWDGAGWNTLTATSNPAAHLRDIYGGKLNLDPIPAAIIDDAALVDFRDRCLQLGYTVNTVVEGMTAKDVADMVAACGYGRPRMSEKWGVLVDKDRSNDLPIQIFNPRNMDAFRWEKAFPKRPDGFRVKYWDASPSRDYGETQIMVPDIGKTAEGIRLSEEISYQGLTSEFEANTRAVFDLGQSRQRATFYYGECDIEALVAQRGDLIGVQHDVIAASPGYARIKEVLLNSAGLIDGLVLDQAIAIISGQSVFLLLDDPDSFITNDPVTGFFESGGLTGIAVRLTNGMVLTKQVTGTGEETDTIDFVTPFADLGLNPADGETPLLDQGCLLQSGRTSQEYRRLILFDATPKPDLSATLTFVDEAPDLFPFAGVNGFCAAYFNSMDLSGPAVYRTVENPWNVFPSDNATPPRTGVNATKYSARWCGYITAPITGDLTIYMIVDDGGRLWLDDHLLIDKWIDQSPTTYSTVISVTAGQLIKARFEYYENRGGAIAKLEWSYTGNPQAKIPDANLTHL